MGHYQIKQVIIVRADLNMRRGKECAQAAHASMATVIKNLDHPDVKEWLNTSFAKIVVSVDSAEELLHIVELAKNKGLLTATIVDRGFTEFGGVHTLTAAAIGPSKSENFVGITDHLKLR